MLSCLKHCSFVGRKNAAFRKIYSRRKSLDGSLYFVCVRYVFYSIILRELSYF